MNRKRTPEGPGYSPGELTDRDDPFDPEALEEDELPVNPSLVSDDPEDEMIRRIDQERARKKQQ